MPSYTETADATANTSTTYSIGMSQSAQAQLSYEGDRDWYKVNLQAGETYTFAMAGTRTSDTHNTYTDAANTYLSLRDGTGKRLAADDNSGPGYNSTITFTAKTSGTYFLDAGFANDNNTGQYGISATLGNKAFYDEKMATGALTWNDTSWVPSTATEPATVTWGVRKTFDDSVDSQGLSTPFIQLSAAQAESVKVNLAKYSDVANITFQQVNPGGTTDNAQILVSAYSAPYDPSGAYAYNPDTHPDGGDIRLNNLDVSTTSLPEGSYSAFTILHEIGHAIGFAHPGDYNAGDGGPLTYQADGAFAQDNHQYTVMSYFDEAYTGASYNSFPDTLMLYDIFAVQQLYGAKMSTRASDSIYGFGSNTGATYNFAINKTPVFSIWDGGGIDTINASGFSQNQLINLHQGAFSSIGGLKANVSIAYNVIIENAIGGSGADTMSGNSSNNVINGGTGADRMVGGLGNDTYYVDNAGDVVAEASGAAAGADKVFSSISYSIATQIVENIYLTGSGNLAATGNNFANGVVGNSGNNVLNGGLGSDYLVGGAGNDFFTFNTVLGVSNVDTIKDFNVLQDTIRVDNAIFTALGGAGALAASAFHVGTGAHDADDRIIYNSATSGLFYDSNGSAAGGAVQFATLSKGLGMTNADFLIV